MATANIGGRHALDTKHVIGPESSPNAYVALVSNSCSGSRAQTMADRERRALLKGIRNGHRRKRSSAEASPRTRCACPRFRRKRCVRAVAPTTPLEHKKCEYRYHTETDSMITGACKTTRESYQIAASIPVRPRHFLFGGLASSPVGVVIIRSFRIRTGIQITGRA